MTIKKMTETVKNELLAAGVETPALEARFLVEALCGVSRKDMILSGEMMLTDDEVNSITDATSKRTIGFPLQYLLGKWEFFGYPFYVGEGVLIPRPDTEILVQAVLDMMKEQPKPAVADLCSGSGCIAVSIAKQRADSRVMAVELSQEAYPYLERNIELNNTVNVVPVQGDVLGALSEKFTGAFDIIVSNPPYIKTGDMRKLQREVRYEPDIALDGRKDGLHFYRGITAKWKSCLKDGGILLFETGADQAAEVAAILEENGLAQVAVTKDLNGIDRVVSAVKLSAPSLPA